MSLAETIRLGLNNPECAFFVGSFMGNMSTGRTIVFLGLIYFGFKFIDKFIFSQIPKLWKWMKKK